MKSLEIIDKYIGTIYALSDDELKQIKQDLEVLEILKKYIELEKEDSDPYDECAFYEDVLYMNINLEWDTTRVEATKLKKWLEERVKE